MSKAQSTSSKPQPHPYVLFVHVSDRFWTGCDTYRMLIPSAMLRRMGYVVDYAHARSIDQKVLQGENPLPLYDIIVIQRTFANNEQLVRLLKQRRKKIVLEIDDDFTNQYREVMSPEGAAKLWRFAREDVDAVTCSTPYLAKLMSQETGKPTYVLPNSVDIQAWRAVQKRPNLTIALTGSATHKADWDVLRDVIPEILGQFPAVHLLQGGFVPEYHASLQYRFPNQVEYFSYASYEDYRQQVGSSHIVLCPVDPDDGFNLSKSGIKAVEGQAAGAAIIATDVQIYREVVPHAKYGTLVSHTPDAWYGALLELITDPAQRQAQAGNARQYAYAHHGIHQNASRWWDAYRAIGGSNAYSIDDRRTRLVAAERQGRLSGRRFGVQVA